MDAALWAAALVLYVAVARYIGSDMARLGRGGRGGWRYALTFLIAPYLGVVAWLIDRRRFRLS